MRKTIALLGLLPAMIATVPGRAQEPEPPLLTLERAIVLAETHNRQLRAADARLAAAEAGIDEARSHRLPRLDLVGGLQRTDNPVLVFSNLLSQESFRAENFELDNLNRPDPLSNWKAAVALELPLWSGGRIAAGVESARHLRDGTAAERQSTRQQVVREVTRGYATAVLAGHQLAVAREALATAAAHVTLTTDLWQSGLVVESDLLLARVRESEIREVLIRAESGVEISRAALNLTLGRDLATPFALPQTLELKDLELKDLEIRDLELKDDSKATSLARRIEDAHQNRPDLQAARQSLAASEAQVVVARAGKRPQVGLQANYEANAEDFFGRDGDNWTVGVGFRVPLFERQTRARAEQASARASEAAELTELLRQQVALEVRRAFHELRAAGQRLEQAAEGAALARRSLTIVEDRYKEGLSTLPELLDAETALTEARLRQVAAHRDVLLARADLDLASGDL